MICISLDALTTDFNPLPPYGGRRGRRGRGTGRGYFNPLPPYGGRQIIFEIGGIFLYFNPLPPYGGRPVGIFVYCDLTVFQSTPSVWRETGTATKQTKRPWNFNPLPPYGGRQYVRKEGAEPVQFQSTPSVWRETQQLGFPVVSKAFQSTPSVWRETGDLPKLLFSRVISIHSLRMEGDGCTNPESIRENYFNPLPPYGGRPYIGTHRRQHSSISIHSLRMEGDHYSILLHFLQGDFNPLPPYGGRPVSFCHNFVDKIFQSTPSVWRETAVYFADPVAIEDFNPLPPYGGRPFCLFHCNSSKFISIHSLRMEGDSLEQFQQAAERHISIHSLRMEGDW